MRQALQCLEKEPDPPPLPDASAPAPVIDPVPPGDEGSAARLSATLTGGTYDGAPEHAWSVSAGALDDPSLASPTWTRPAVAADAHATISLTVTARGDGTSARSGTSDSASAGASVLVRDKPPPPPQAPPSSCVSDGDWDTVAGHYDSNKDRGDRRHGSNWYRVLIAYRGEDPERTLPTWEGATAKPTSPYTVKEAEDGEEAWSGWTPVREVLECLEGSQQATVEPDPPQPQQGSQDQQVAATVSVVFPRSTDASFASEITEGISWRNDNCVSIHVKLSQPISQGYRYTITYLHDDSTADLTNELHTNGNNLTKGDISVFNIQAGNKISGTIGSGGTGPSSTTVCVRDDDIYEADETAVFQVANAPDASNPATIAISPSKYAVTIKNDDPKPIITLSAANVVEGEDIDVTVTADRPAQAAYDIKVAVANETKDADRKKDDVVAAKTYTVGMPALSKTATFKVPTIDDGKIHAAAAVVGLSVEAVAADPYAAGAGTTVQATDNGARTIKMTVEMPDSVVEGNGGTRKAINFKLKMFNSPDKTVWIRVKGAGTARPAVFKNNEPVGVDDEPNPNWDYALARGNVKDGFPIGFPANKHSIFTQSITIHGDDAYEGDETIALDVSCETNCGGGNGDDYVIAVVNDSTPITIKDDDPKPVLSISGSSEVTEGDPIKVKVTADRAAQSDYDVELQVSDINTSQGLGSRKAVEPGTRTVTMKGGETEASLSVPTIEHSYIEDRQGRISIKGGTGFPYKLKTDGASHHTFDVRDKLDAYTVWVRMPNNVTEGSGGSTQTVLVNIALAEAAPHNIVLRGRAVEGAGHALPTRINNFHAPYKAGGGGNPYWDYAFTDDHLSRSEPFGHTFTIQAGTTSINRSVIVHGDDVYEGTEQIKYVVTCESGCGVDGLYKVNVVYNTVASATFIIDDDPKPDLSLVKPGNATEGGDVTLTVNADRKAQAPYDFHVRISEEGRNEERRTLTMPSHADSKTTIWPAAKDSAYKHRKLGVLLERSSGYGYTADNPNRGVSSYILDAIKPVVSATDVAIVEGQDLPVTVSADRAHVLDYDVRVSLRKHRGPENVVDNLLLSKTRHLTIKAGTTEAVPQNISTRNNQRRDGNVEGAIIIFNPGSSDLWAKGGEGSFKITDTGDSNIPIVGFKRQANGQGGLYTCESYEEVQGTRTAFGFDIGTENVHGFDCNLSVEAVPSGGVEFDLKLEVTVPNRGEHERAKAEIAVNVESDGVTPVRLHPGRLTDFDVDQGDSYIVTVKILPDPAYTVAGLDETYIELTEAHDFYGHKNSMHLGVRAYDGSDSASYPPFPVVRVDELLGEILEFQLTTTYSHYRADTFRIRFDGLNGALVTDLIDERHLEEDNGSFYLKRSHLDPETQTQVDDKVTLRPWGKTVVFRVPLRSTRGDLDREQDHNYDSETGRATHLLRITPILECPAACSVNLHPTDITYFVYPPQTSTPLDPDDPDYVQNAHEYGARLCFEKNIPTGTLCGEGGNQFLIEYGHDPEAFQDEEELDFYVYATPALDEEQTVLMEWTGRNKRGGDPINTGQRLISVPREGASFKLPFDTRDLPQWDDTLDVTFKAVDSLYQVLGEHKSHVIKVRNNDPMKWVWTENTLGNLDEGGFTKIAKIAMVKPHFMVIPDDAEWGLDFNVKGCALQNTNPYPNGPSSSGDIPCFMDLKPSSQKTEPDSFRGTGYVSNGWTFSASVGQDDDLDDEVITFDPEFNFPAVQVLQRGFAGDCDRDSGNYNKQCLGNFVAYDDDVADKRVTSAGIDMCVSFSLSNYQVVESNGPAQPVLRLHEYDASEPDAGKRCKDGLNGTADRGVDTDNLLREAEVLVTFSHDTTDVADFQHDYAANNPIRALFPSKGGTTAKFDVSTVGSDGYEGHEHFDLAILSVSNGLHIGNRSTARVEMQDNPDEIRAEIENICDHPKWKANVNYAKGAKVREPGSRDFYVRKQAGKDGFESENPSNNSADWEKDGYLSGTCRQNITVEVLTEELYESDISSGQVKVRTRITATRDWNMKGADILIFEARNDRGLYVEKTDDGMGGTDSRNRGRVTEAGSIPSALPFLKANVPMEVTYGVPVSSKHSSKSDDWPDGSFFLRAKESPHYDSVSFIRAHWSYNRSESERIWLRDGTEGGDRNDIAFWADKASAGNFKNNHDNLFYVGVRDDYADARNLMNWETVEFPIEVLDENYDPIPVEDYELKLVSAKGHIKLKELEDGTYSFQIKGTFGSPGNVNVGGSPGGNFDVVDSFSCGEKSINHHRAGCLNYINKRKDGEDGDLESSYTVWIGPETTAGSGSYGNTENTTYAVPSKSVGSFTVSVDPSSPPAVVAARTVTIDPVGGTEVTEPPSNGERGLYASRTDVAFDIEIEPALPEEKHIVVEMCMDGDSTASYYSDYRIMEWADGYHDMTTGGEPYDQGTRCTKTKAQLSDIKTRFYLRVHGDNLDEGSEKVAMSVKVLDCSGGHDVRNNQALLDRLRAACLDGSDNVIWPGDSAKVTWTINDPAKSSMSKKARQPGDSPARDGEEIIQVDDGSGWGTALTGAAGGGLYHSFRQSWYEGGTHFLDGEGFDESGLRTALYAMLEISLVTAHDPDAAIPYGEADRGVCLDPADVPSRLEFEGFALRPLKWRDAPEPHLCRSFLDFENNGSWLGSDGLLVNEWGMYVRLGIVDDDEANGDEETPAGFPFILDNPAFPVEVEGGTLDMDAFIILDDDGGGAPR